MTDLVTNMSFGLKQDASPELKPSYQRFLEKKRLLPFSVETLYAETGL
jgi:hypothetical protein